MQYYDQESIFEHGSKEPTTCEIEQNIVPLNTGRNSKGELIAHKAIDNHVYDNVSLVGKGEEEEDADKDIELLEAEGFYRNEGSDDESDEPVEHMSLSSDNLLADKGEVDIVTDKQHTKIKIWKGSC